jgi:hypothetical protein
MSVAYVREEAAFVRKDSRTLTAEVIPQLMKARFALPS